MTQGQVTLDGYLPMAPLEIAAGWVYGTEEPLPRVSSEEPSASPRQVLEEIIRQRLADGPCMVTFSGGRDSSAILAVALHVAQREGLPKPVPLTFRYPSAPHTHENHWQETVIDHLAVEDWVTISLEDELDLLGRESSASLLRNGIVWPITVHGQHLKLAPARGNTVISGEGGDNVFGLMRTTALAGLLAGRVHPRRRALRELVGALPPRPLRRLLIRNDLRERSHRPWLRLAAQETFHNALRDDVLSEPLLWNRGIRYLTRRRSMQIGHHNLDVNAQTMGVTLVHPLLDPRFLNAWATFGGRLGVPSRAAAMELLVGDLLPEALIGRRDKAEFGNAMIRQETRHFIDRWDGSALPGQLLDLIDVNKIREAWAAPRPHAGSLPALQAAWLGEQGQH